MDSFDGVAKRKLSNFLLKPMLQSKIGIYFILISLLFSASVGSIIYYNFSDLFYSVLQLTDAPQEVGAIIKHYWSSVESWIMLCIIVYVATTVVISIWYTHRFVGPAVAFLRHLNEINAGNYTYRTHLRRGDAFAELANGLNKASEALEISHRSAKLDIEPGITVEPATDSDDSSS